MSCCNYNPSCQEKQNYYQPPYWYYYPQQPSYNMVYPITTPIPTAVPEFELPMYNNNNVLQDDNFSIVTASDLYNASPSVPPHLTPYSTPSPQLSEVYTQSENYNNQYNYSMLDLFAPVETKRVIADTEKKHICPICGHRSKRRHNLVEHMLTHNPHRPKTFKCSHCGRPFARKYDMKRHEKIHTR